MDQEFSITEISTSEPAGYFINLYAVFSQSSQGSVISPILFNVFVDDPEDAVPNDLTVNTCKYADGCTQDELIYPDSQSNMHEVSRCCIKMGK